MGSAHGLATYPCARYTPTARPSCSYLPRTRMRMLNSSAVLNGQPAILVCSVTSIQPPPETIQAWPINQPIRPAVPEPTTISLSLPPSLPQLLPHPRLSPVLIARTSSHLPLPSRGPSWQTARSNSPCVPAPPTIQPHPAYTPIPYAVSTIFFLPLESVPGGLSAQ